MTFVPDFGKESSPDRHIAFICSKGNLDMAYPALVMGNAALGEGVKCSFFFTFWGMDMIIKSRQDHLMFSPAGNSAMHMPGGSDMHFPQSMSLLPGMTGMATSMIKKEFEKLNVPPVPEFLDMITAAGGELWACLMSADMNKVTEKDLRDDVSGIITAGAFIEMTDGAQIIFI